MNINQNTIEKCIMLTTFINNDNRSFFASGLKNEILEDCSESEVESFLLFLETNFSEYLSITRTKTAEELRIIRKNNLTDSFVKKDILQNWLISKTKEAELSEKNKKKLNIDLANAERVYKSYPTTRFITWAGFIISILLGYLKIAETIKLWPYHK